MININTVKEKMGAAGFQISHKEALAIMITLNDMGIYDPEERLQRYIDALHVEILNKAADGARI